MLDLIINKHLFIPHLIWRKYEYCWLSSCFSNI